MSSEHAIPTKKQCLSSEIQTGACVYCGQCHQIETSGAATEEELDQWATEKCDCIDANRAKNRKKIQARIDSLFAERYIDTAETLKGIVEAMQDMKIAKITIDTGDGVKAQMSMTTKGFIKIERTETRKTASQL